MTRRDGLFRRAAPAALLAALILSPGAFTGAAAGATDWTAYLDGPEHLSINSTTAVTTSNTGALSQAWAFRAGRPTMAGQPGPAFYASPTVSGGVIYIGSNSGDFYAVKESTGKALWKRFIGFVKKLTCGGGRGITATATVATDPASGHPAVYVSGGDGYLYALDAATGTQLWRSVIALPSPTQNDYYDWSSPTVAGGSILIGIASQCDAPLVQGAVKQFSQATGALLATYSVVPNGSVGGGVWSSLAETPGGVAFVTTGNSPPGTAGDGASVVSLDANHALARIDAWAVPAAQQVRDSDFGASPTLFTATLRGKPTEMVGACNKNGRFYALRASKLSAGPVWTYALANPSKGGFEACLAAAIWDGSHLYVAGGPVTINGTAFNGSMTALDPATGAPLWRTGLGGAVLGSPAMDGAGVIGVATYTGGTVVDGAYLLAASSGAVLRFMATGSEFAQPVFADSYLLLAAKRNNLLALR